MRMVIFLVIVRWDWQGALASGYSVVIKGAQEPLSGRKAQRDQFVHLRPSFERTIKNAISSRRIFF